MRSLQAENRKKYKKNYKLINFTNRQIDFPRFRSFLVVTTYADGVLGDDLVKGTVLAQGIMIPYADAMSLLKTKIYYSVKKESQKHSRLLKVQTLTAWSEQR